LGLRAAASYQKRYSNPDKATHRFTLNYKRPNANTDGYFFCGLLQQSNSKGYPGGMISTVLGTGTFGHQ